MRNEILIIGGSGSLGTEIREKYNNIKVFTYNKNFIKDGVKFDAVNMELEQTIENLDRFKDAIILLADKDPNSCYKNKKYSPNSIQSHRLDLRKFIKWLKVDEDNFDNNMIHLTNFSI